MYYIFVYNIIIIVVRRLKRFEMRCILVTALKMPQSSSNTDVKGHPFKAEKKSDLNSPLSVQDYTCLLPIQ